MNSLPFALAAIVGIVGLLAVYGPWTTLGSTKKPMAGAGVLVAAFGVALATRLVL